MPSKYEFIGFATIDFELANKNLNSACSLAIVTVDEGKIDKQYQWYIKPPEMDFLPEFVDMHGITPEMVQDMPTFAEIWPDVAGVFWGNNLVAHNAEFHISVLNALLEHYRLPYKPRKYICSCEVARELWKYEKNDLESLCKKLRIGLKHHDSLSDATACAQIMLKACRKLECELLQDISKSLPVHLKTFNPPYLVPREKELLENFNPEAFDAEVNRLLSRCQVDHKPVIKIAAAKFREMMINKMDYKEAIESLSSPYENRDSLCSAIVDVLSIAGKNANVAKTNTPADKPGAPTQTTDGGESYLKKFSDFFSSIFK